MSGAAVKIVASAAVVLAAAGIGGGVRYAIGGGGHDGPSTSATSTDDPAMGPQTDITLAMPSDDPSTDDAASAADDSAAVTDCDAKVAELERREEADLIDWEAHEVDLVDPESADEGSIELTLSPIDGRVAGPGERFEPERFGAEFDLAAVSDGDLLEAVDLCFVTGVLVDDEFEEEQAPVD